MKPEAEQQATLDLVALTHDMESDIVRLGEYIAKKRGMSLAEFLEYLIMKEASVRKEVSV